MHIPLGKFRRTLAVNPVNHPRGASSLVTRRKRLRRGLGFVSFHYWFLKTAKERCWSSFPAGPVDREASPRFVAALFGFELRWLCLGVGWTLELGLFSLLLAGGRS